MSAGSVIPGSAGLFSLRPRSLSRCLVSAVRILGASHERGMCQLAIKSSKCAYRVA